MTGNRNGGQFEASRPGRLRQWAVWIASCFGLVGGLQTGASIKPASAQDTAYRASEAAPPEWRVFANQLRAILLERLSTNEDAARAIHKFVDARDADSKPERTIEARVWVAPNGDLERLDFIGVDSDLAIALRRVFARERFVPLPPPGMLQPVHLRLSFSDQK